MAWYLRMPLFYFIILAISILGLITINPDSAFRKSLKITDSANGSVEEMNEENSSGGRRRCATVEEMGEIFNGSYLEESIRVRKVIHAHFYLNGASRVREWSPELFCNHGFVAGKASNSGLGNELYKILTAAALSLMLNRSLIIDQTRGSYPFGDYINYSDVSFTMEEVKDLWRQNECHTKYGRDLTMRTDDYKNASQTHALCSNWRQWEHPIIRFYNTYEGTAAQLFLKNIHSSMREAALNLFGRPGDLQHRANVFGELLRILISPSIEINAAVNWALNGGRAPDIAIHMRMMRKRSSSANEALLECLRKVFQRIQLQSKPRVVIISDTPDMLRDLVHSLRDIVEVIYFDYKQYHGSIPNGSKLRIQNWDWGPAPRWVAIVDFFLASRAQHAVITGGHDRIGTTYAQLIAALAATYTLDEDVSNPSPVVFFSSFQEDMVSEGLQKQVGWGRVWSRFNGPLSCHNQSNQCALTPISHPGWWDGRWQSVNVADVEKLKNYGIKYSSTTGSFDKNHLLQFCSTRNHTVTTVSLI